MITVLILDRHDKRVEPVVGKNKSRSLMPVSLTNSILGIIFSWINSYFSLDKIFVVCTPEEKEDVRRYCKGINEENIIIEPERINYSMSIFYATLFIGSIFSGETVFFIPVNFLFNENFKFGNFIFAADEITQKECTVLPSILLNKEEKPTEYIDAGKLVENVKGTDFFRVEKIVKDDLLKKRKMFGKYGKMLSMIVARHDNIHRQFLSDGNTHTFIKSMNDYFLSEDIQWDVLVNEYKKNRSSIVRYDFFSNDKNFVTNFIESDPSLFLDWNSVLSKFSSKDGNLICGNIVIDNCKSVICFNHDEEPIELSGLNNTIVYKKGRTIVQKFF